MAWTQPLCYRCWNADNPDRTVENKPVGPPERCCIDPATVPYPQKDG